jgi:hypothetical protein
MQPFYSNSGAARQTTCTLEILVTAHSAHDTSIHSVYNMWLSNEDSASQLYLYLLYSRLPMW